MTAMHRVQQAEEEVSRFARAVTLKRATVTAVAGFLLMVAVHKGWITPGFSDDVKGWTEDGLGLATTLGAGAWIHQSVTPSRQDLQPRNDAGQLLIPDSSQPAAGGVLPPTVSLNPAPDDGAGPATADTLPTTPGASSSIVT